MLWLGGSCSLVKRSRSRSTICMVSSTDSVVCDSHTTSGASRDSAVPKQQRAAITTTADHTAYGMLGSQQRGQHRLAHTDDVVDPFDRGFTQDRCVRFGLP
jgi:hypothetical protein